MQRAVVSILALAAVAGVAAGQGMKGGKKAPASPPAETSVTINGKAISIKYSAPSLRGRDVFGPNGPIRKDPTYPVWRAGANSATALHTEADLDINGLAVPKGDYTLFVLPNEGKWQLIVNKQTGQWGLTYDQSKDLGRVPMTMSKPASPVETFKITLSADSGNRGKLQMEWADVAASVPLQAK
jgi:hypothetical protein